MPRGKKQPNIQNNSQTGFLSLEARVAPFNLDFALSLNAQIAPSSKMAGPKNVPIAKLRLQENGGQGAQMAEIQCSFSMDTRQ